MYVHVIWLKKRVLNRYIPNASMRLCSIIALTSQNFSFDLNEMKDKLKIRLGKLNMERAIIIIFGGGGVGSGLLFLFQIIGKACFLLVHCKANVTGDKSCENILMLNHFYSTKPRC